MTTLIDDHLLLEALLGRSRVEGPVTTTTHWWWRLARAVRREAGGALSGPVLALEPTMRAVLVDAIDAVGSAFEVTEFSAVLAIAADVSAAHGVNLLAADALATAMFEDARIAVGVDSPPLARAAVELGVDYSVV